MTNRTPLTASGRPPDAALRSEKGSLREDLKRFTSEKLLRAAMTCFAEQGFRATTVERIVEVAGTTAPTFYRHFPSKNDLLAPLRAHLTQAVADTLAQLDGDGCRSLQGVRAWLEDYLKMWRRVHRLCEAYWEATSSDLDFAAEAVPQTIAATEVLERFFQRVPTAEREPTALRLAMLILFLDRLAFLVGVETSPVRVSQMTDQFAEMLWTSIFQRYAQA